MLSGEWHCLNDFPAHEPPVGHVTRSLRLLPSEPPRFPPLYRPRCRRLYKYTMKTSPPVIQASAVVRSCQGASASSLIANHCSLERSCRRPHQRQESLYGEPPHDTTAHLLGERGQISLGEKAEPAAIFGRRLARRRAGVARSGGNSQCRRASGLWAASVTQSGRRSWAHRGMDEKSVSPYTIAATRPMRATLTRAPFLPAASTRATSLGSGGPWRTPLRAPDPGRASTLIDS